MEATGDYQRGFVHALHRAGIKVSVVNAARHVRDFAKSMGQNAKTDKIDAAMIARYASAKSPRPDPVPSEAQLRLTEMVCRRGQLVEARVMETNRLEYVPAVRKQAQATIEFLNQRIAELEKLIKSEIASDETLKMRGRQKGKMQADLWRPRRRQVGHLHGGSNRSPKKSDSRSLLQKTEGQNRARTPFKVAIVAVMRKLIMLLNHMLKNPDFSLAR